MCNPNFQDYAYSEPVLWWDFEADDILWFYHGGNRASEDVSVGAGFKIYVFFVSGNDDTVYIYVFAKSI
jgi:hypothetical protein